LINLGPKARSWLSTFFLKIITDNSIPKIWRKVKVIAIEKPNKDPTMAASYRPVSLVSVCYKLLERVIFPRVKSTVESIINSDQDGLHL